MELLFPLLILLLFIPIFLSGRRQRRQVAEMQKMQSALEVGDVVITTSGLRGTVVDASYEDTVDIEIADGVVTTWVRGAVREKVTTGAEDVAIAGDGDTVTSGAVTSGTVPGDTVTSTDAVGETAPVRQDQDLDLDRDRDKAPSLEKDDSANGTPRS